MTVTRTQLEGCTHPSCGSQQTVTLDARHGRRCANHPPVFDPAVAVELAVDGQPITAAWYCATDLPMPRKAAP